MARRSLIAGVDLPAATPAPDNPVVGVARRPDDLAAHERRIADATEPDDRFGALVDLWIATGPEAVAVRRAALDAVGGELDADARAVLAQHVVDGLDPADPLPPCGTSQLTLGVTDARPLTTAANDGCEEPAPVATGATGSPPSAAPSEREPSVPPAGALVAEQPRGASGGRRVAVAFVAAAVLAALVLGVVALSRRPSPDDTATAGVSSTSAADGPAPASTRAPSGAPSESTGPTSPGSTGPASTTSDAPASVPTTAAAELVATDAVVQLLGALRDPAAPWPADGLAPDAPAGADLAAVRSELARTGTSWDVAVLDVTAETPTEVPGATTLTVAVAVDHDGVTVRHADGHADPVTGPGTIVLRVELRPGGDGALEVWSVALTAGV